MKNKEKYAKEIIEIACDGNGIAVDKHSETVDSCLCISCSNCLFNDNKDCDKGRREWAESEYTEKQVISKRDRTFLECIIEEYKFVARDESGNLFVYKTQPRKMETRWVLNRDGYLYLNRHFNVDFPMVKWEDNEPWLIEDLKKLEVVEKYEK